jgi:hypothetical protein
MLQKNQCLSGFFSIFIRNPIPYPMQPAMPTCLIRRSLYFILLTLLFSCRHDDSSIQRVLEKAGNNRIELEKVLDHYKKASAEKKKAAYFLIENMDTHFSYGGDVVRDFDGIMGFLDSLHKRKIKIPVASPLVKGYWDSIVDVNGRPTLMDAEEVYDPTTITSSFLIDNIEWAYTAWQTSKWAKGLSLNDFCDYILPYRNGTEQLEPWREHLYKRFEKFRDTSRASNRYEAASALNTEMRKFIGINHTMRNYPFDMTVSQMERARRGACRQVVFYTANCMRANGIPVGVDFALCWGDHFRGHEWNVLLQEDGKMFPFNAAGTEFTDFAKTPYRTSKIFRITFAKQHLSFPPASEVPESLFNDHAKDVTEEYTKCFDVEVDLNWPNSLHHQYAVICTFKARDWSAQDWGIIENKKARFKKMGADIIYMVMYYRAGKYYPATYPFILRKDGTLSYIVPNDQKADITLHRKYPYLPINIYYAEPLIGARLQLANKSDFSDSITVGTVDSMPVKYEEVDVTDQKPYRYARFLTAKGHRTNLAEFEVYGIRNGKEVKLSGLGSGQPQVLPELGTSWQMAFDNNPETYFSGSPDSLSWVELDLKKPTIITKLRYCPRSDVNYIVAGDEYELKYWNGQKWISLSRQTATDQSLLFKNVPAGQIYLLHNRSHGNEERIFTYENGKQVWW